MANGEAAHTPARVYVVLREHANEHGSSYMPVSEVEATSAGQACVRAAAGMSDSDVDKGVVLIAVPARSWKNGRYTMKAETTRRIRSA